MEQSPPPRVLELMEVQSTIRAKNEEDNEEDEEEKEKVKVNEEYENCTDLCLCLAPPKASPNPVPILVPIVKHGAKRDFREFVANVNNDAKQTQFGSEFDTTPPKISEESDPPPAKDRVIGWPPIRSYRKNTLATTNANDHIGHDGDNKSTVYVKVNMDGIPIGRKVDLKAYQSYESLQIALGEMFHSPSCGHSSHFLCNKEFVLTYEDQEGDWMLVGDVPWGMFVNAVKRLRIVRPSEATGIS